MPESPPPSLWRDDESWTDEALYMDSRFRDIVRDFINNYPEYKIRDMEMLLISCVHTTALDLILDERFGFSMYAPPPEQK